MLLVSRLTMSFRKPLELGLRVVPSGRLIPLERLCVESKSLIPLYSVEDFIR